MAHELSMKAGSCKAKELRSLEWREKSCACFANMSCQRLSIVSNFVSIVLFCNGIIVESMIIKLSLAKRSVFPL